MTDLLVLGAAAISAILGADTKPTANECVVSDTGSKYFVRTEEAPLGTKCYVDAGSAEAVEAMGWGVEQDESGYFYRVTKGKQKIVGVSTFHSDLSELREKLIAAENTAITYQTYKVNPDPLYMNNAVLGYVRSFNSNYVTDGASVDLAWVATAGTVDPRLTALIDNMKDCRGYFSNFVSNRNYCSVMHPTTSLMNPHADERGNDSNYFSYFRDPVTNRHKIDLIHMFASMDGCYDWTLFDAKKGLYAPTIFPSLTHELVSWAGDLQQAANAIQSKIDNNEDTFDLAELSKCSFEDIMSGDYGCSESDIYADIDAVNITDLYLTGPGRTSDSLRDYYGSVHNDTQRINYFVDAVMRGKDGLWTGTKNQRFVKEIYDALGLVYSDGTVTESTAYYTSNAICDMKFKIMKSNNVTPTKEVRKAVAEKFCKYIFSLC